MARPVKPTGRIILIASLGALIAAAIGIWLAGGAFDRDGFLGAARLTARWSFVCFMLVWSASALARLWAGGWRSAVLYNRRGLGLGFAAAHMIHAGFFITAIALMGARSSATTIFGGGLGYVFVILLALTSHDYWVKRLGKAWKLLHQIGVTYIAFIFAFTYYGSLDTKPGVAVATLSTMALVLALRVTAWVKARTQQARSSAA
jgi:DMSO/TMAO reductase YedYZ heme-binding membrane subunit